MTKYGLADAELHTAWLLRGYFEQSRIANFEKLPWDQRRSAVLRERAATLLRLQQSQEHKAFKQTKKDYAHTEAYVHLTRDERRALVRDMADCVSGWGFARIFSEDIDKLHFDPARTGRTIAEQAFEQVVSRFERYLSELEVQEPGVRVNGILVHDNNETVARKHTSLMRDFHQKGTLWINVSHIIETPLFVDSKLTRMVQIADLVAYAFRRFHENQEADLFRRVFSRANRYGRYAVGVRHYTALSCVCEMCQAHRGA